MIAYLLRSKMHSTPKVLDKMLDFWPARSIQTCGKSNPLIWHRRYPYDGWHQRLDVFMAALDGQRQLRFQHFTFWSWNLLLFFCEQFVLVKIWQCFTFLIASFISISIFLKWVKGQSWPFLLKIPKLFFLNWFRRQINICTKLESFQMESGDDPMKIQ